MFRRTFCATAVITALLTSVSIARADGIDISGSTTVSGTVLLPYESKIEKQAGAKLNIASVGSSRGLLALVDGQADIAAISAPLPDVVRKINGKEPGRIDGRELTAHDIGSTKVAFIVHPSNPVKELSFDQITDILAGRITLWSELGGPAQKIDIISEYKGGGIRTLVEKTIGEWGDVLAATSDVQTGNQVIFAVSQLPNAFGITTAATVNNNVYMLRSDRSIEQPMYLVTKGQPGARLAKLIESVRAINLGANGGV